MTSVITRRLVATFWKRPAQRDDTARLTPGEEEVLTLLSKGFPSKEIADKMSVS